MEFDDHGRIISKHRRELEHTVVVDDQQQPDGPAGQLDLFGQSK